MANRYWVGGTASWDGTAGTKWATTSGGAGGASVPTSVDDVFFDANSTGTCTVSSGNTGAKSINCTGFVGGLTVSSSLTLYGNLTLVSGMTYTHGLSPIYFDGNATIITAGKLMGNVQIGVNNNVTVDLGDSYATSGSTRVITIANGTFNTNNYNYTAGAIGAPSANINTKIVNLGSSTVLLQSSTALSVITEANTTFNAGTSQINLSAASASINSTVSRTFYNVSFTSTLAGTRSIFGTHTFNNLTLNASATGLSQLSLSDNQTVNGTFTCAGASAIARGFVRSNAVGTVRTITAAVISANDCDFRDITIAGAASPISPTRAGDCGGNTNITFPAAKTVYRVGTGTTWATSLSWAATSGGTGDDNYYPLPQDTAVIDNNTTLTGTLNLGSTVNIGTVDCSSRTTGITINHNASLSRYGSYTFGSGVTVSGTSAQTFSGRGTMTFTSAGKTITFQILLDTPGGTFQLGDATTTSSQVTHLQGTFNANNYNLTCAAFVSNNSNTRTITMGSGLWTLSGTGSGVWDLLDPTNLTFNKDTANILFSSTSTAQRNFRGGGLSYNKFTIGGATGTSITALVGTNNSFSELASTKPVAHTIQLLADQGTIGTWSVTGSSGNIVTVNSSIAGTRRNFTLTNVTSGIDYLAVQDIGVTDANRFYVGANSTDNGNNLNVIFTDPPPPPPSTATGNMFMLFN